MADITMCCNEKCEMRNTCYRRRAIPSEWQLWAIFETKDGDCDGYIEYVPHTRESEYECCYCGHSDAKDVRHKEATQERIRIMWRVIRKLCGENKDRIEKEIDEAI